MAPAKRRAAWLLALVILCFLVLFVTRISREMIDFTVNDTAGSRLSWGESLYRAGDGHYQFKYPPFAAMLYIPLSLLPLPAAKAVWFALVLLASIGAFTLSFRLASDGKKGAGWLAVLPLFVLGRYFFREIQLGQINAILTYLLLVMAGLFVKAERKSAPGSETGAGLLWGLAVALKPYALIFLPYFIIKRKTRSLVSGASFLVLAFLMPSLYYGLSGNIAVHKEWFKTLAQSTPQLLTSQDNASLLAMFAKWTGRPNLSVSLWAGALVLLAGFLFFIIRRGRSQENPAPLDCGLLLLFIPLVSPLGWDYTFLSSVLAVSLIARHYFDFPIAARVVLSVVFLIIPLSLYDVLGRSFYARYMSLSIITIAFLVLAGYAAALRLKNIGS
jgi:alpha-1,2-mannosyltransferase